MENEIFLGLKKRKPIAKLDAAKLLSDKGFPLLLKLTKNFKTSDKGPNDLREYLKMLKDWAHMLFPKMEFNDFICIVEKRCKESELFDFLNEIKEAHVTPK